MNTVYTSSQVGGILREEAGAGVACFHSNSGDWQLPLKSLFLVTSPKVSTAKFPCKIHNLVRNKRYFHSKVEVFSLGPLDSQQQQVIYTLNVDVPNVPQMNPRGYVNISRIQTSHPGPGFSVVGLPWFPGHGRSRHQSNPNAQGRSRHPKETFEHLFNGHPQHHPQPFLETAHTKPPREAVW